jgi:tetratricopeptide (TPR) repeat protein
MIFCESFIPHDCQPEQDQHFDRRDCYLITQNAVADPTYLDYIRAQYNDSLQTNPPFFQNLLPSVMPNQFHEPTKALVWLDDIFESIGASVERDRRTRTSWFKPEDFRDPAKMAARLRPHAGQDGLSKYVFEHLSKETQTLVGGTVAGPAVGHALAQDFNVILTNVPPGKTIYSPELFAGVKLPVLIQKAVEQDQTSNLVVRLNRRLLEEAYPDEIAKSLGGVYPDTEIHTSTMSELRVCEDGYTHDAALRYQHDHEHPNEPHQLKPGEDVVADDSGRLSFGGILVVMGINSYVTKSMFDANPDHEFYVEESYPMDWMYPNLLPFGVIMKVNRQPVELTEADMMRDHEFWSQYSTRLIGNWITYDTPVKEVCDFAERVYLHHDYTGFTGDLKFVRDDDAQKGFSKLRSAIGSSIYQNRGNSGRPPAQRARLLKEAEFALKQAFAYCPYSEGASKYAQLLLEAGRTEDALLVARTFQKLDPYNRQVQGMLLELLVNTGKRDEAVATAKRLLEFDPDNPQMESILNQLQNGKAASAPVSAQEIFGQIDSLIAAGRNTDAASILDKIMQTPQANAMLLMQIAQRFAQLRDLPKAEQAIVRATEVEPNVSETWYNLANVRAFEGHAAEAADALKKALAANVVERAANPNFMDLRENARTNPMFNSIRATPEFRAVVPN